MPDTALQNDRVCASRRTKPDGRDLRQNGGSVSGYQRVSKALAAHQSRLRHNRTVSRTAYAYIAALEVNVLICRV